MSLHTDVLYSAGPGWHQPSLAVEGLQYDHCRQPTSAQSLHAILVMIMQQQKKINLNFKFKVINVLCQHYETAALFKRAQFQSTVDYVPVHHIISLHTNVLYSAGSGWHQPSPSVERLQHDHCRQPTSEQSLHAACNDYHDASSDK